MRKVRGGAVAALACLTVSCASLGRTVFQEPVVSYRDARVTGLGVAGGTLEIVLDVYNPNRFRLDGSKLTYKVDIDSVTLGMGSYDDRFTVERGDTAQISLPLSFTYAGLGLAGQRLLQTGTVEYRVSGDMTVSTPLGSFTRPYAGKGRLSTLSRTP